MEGLIWDTTGLYGHVHAGCGGIPKLLNGLRVMVLRSIPRAFFSSRVPDMGTAGTRELLVEDAGAAAMRMWVADLRDGCNDGRIWS